MRYGECLILSLALVLIGTGCSSRTAWIASGVRYQLQPPASLQRQLAAVQKVEASYKESRFGFMTQVEADDETFVLAGLTDGGGRAFLLSDDGKELTYEQHPLFDAPIRPKYLLADIQLIFWPAEAIAAGLKGGTIVDQPGLREILRHGKPVIRIHYGPEEPWQGTTRYEHLQRGYSFVILSQLQD